MSDSQNVNEDMDDEVVNFNAETHMKFFIMCFLIAMWNLRNGSDVKR